MEILQLFGLRLRDLRKSRKLSQQHLASKAGLESSQIGRIERGTTNTSVKQIVKIAEALEIHPRELFDFEIPTGKN